MGQGTRASFVYFAHAADGSAVKVGVSLRPNARCEGAGWALIGYVPGTTAYEFAVHWALRAYQIKGEWFQSCPAVWRFALETISAGCIGWLPPPPVRYPADEAMLEQARARFGGISNAATAIGFSSQVLVGRAATPMMAWGRIYAEIARMDGLLPDYLGSEATTAPQARQAGWSPEMRAALSVALRDAWAARRIAQGHDLQSEAA